MRLLILAIGIFFLNLPSPLVAEGVFELRTYHVAPDKMEPLLIRFREHSLALLSKHGMTHLGYWVPLDADAARVGPLVYVVTHASKNAGRASWGAFSRDPEWHRARDNSEVDGKLVTAFTSVYHVRLPNWVAPENATPAEAKHRVFEFKTFKSSEGGLSKLEACVRSWTSEHFPKHGVHVLDVWRPLDKDKGADTTIVCLLAYRDAEAARAAWRSLEADPTWIESLRTAELMSDQQETGQMTASKLWQPVDFSPLQ